MTIMETCDEGGEVGAVIVCQVPKTWVLLTLDPMVKRYDSFYTHIYTFYFSVELLFLDYFYTYLLWYGLFCHRWVVMECLAVVEGCLSLGGCLSLACIP